MNQFVKQFQATEAQKIILNISSGAGRHTIKSWAEYCASKSALDMLSQVMKEEQKTEKFPINVFSVAPGIIDTEMQKKIRSVQEEDFDKLDYFVDLKTNNLLSSPHEVAMKLLKIINEQDLFNKEVLLDVREF
jgi:benzil reductase ((S)-benzoin forming)